MFEICISNTSAENKKHIGREAANNIQRAICKAELVFMHLLRMTSFGLVFKTEGKLKAVIHKINRDGKDHTSLTLSDCDNNYSCVRRPSPSSVISAFCMLTSVAPR